MLVYIRRDAPFVSREDGKRSAGNIAVAENLRYREYCEEKLYYRNAGIGVWT
jgi:hypothetical protein